MAEPYFIEVDSNGCKNCGHSRTWIVVGPDECADSVSFEDEDEAQRLADDLNAAYFQGHSQSEKRISELEAQLAVEKETWRCFHCGFETADRAEAEAHFGDRDDAEEFKPLCRWWASMSPKERGETLQDTIEQLNSERDENAVLRSKIDGLEYRIHGIVSEIKSFKPFRNCESIHQVFYVYDSMEGRMLVAEEKLAERDRQLKVAREALVAITEAPAASGARGDSYECIIARKALAALDGEQSALAGDEVHRLEAQLATAKRIGAAEELRRLADEWRKERPGWIHQCNVLCYRAAELEGKNAV